MEGRLLELINSVLRLQVEEVPDQEWMDSVRASYQPTQVTDSMWIIPRYASYFGNHHRSALWAAGHLPRSTVKVPALGNSCLGP